MIFTVILAVAGALELFLLLAKDYVLDTRISEKRDNEERNARLRR